MNTNAKRTVMRLVAGVAAVATLMGTAACGSSNSSSSDDNTLTVSYWDDEMQPIKDFIKANPDIKVKQIRVPGDDYNTKLNQMIVGGTAPDVMLTQEADYVRFAKNGVTMKLDDKLKDLGIDKSDFQPAVTDIANQVDGYYGFPQGFATEIMYYNKDMFDAAGVAYPTDDWTWDDYTALIGAAGDKVVDNGKLSFGNGLKKTLEFQKNLVDNKWQPQPASGSKVSDMFAAGKAAMTLGGTWLVSTYKDVDFKWDIATIPTAPGAKKYNSLHTSFWAINAKTKHSAAAEKLVKFLMSKEGQKSMSQSLGNTPAFQSMMADGYYKVQGKNGPSNWSSLEASAKEAKLGYTLVASTPTFNLYDQFNAYVLGQTSLSEVTGTQVAKANKEITDAQ